MVAAKGIPRASASTASCASRCERIRRKRSQVSSGTYFMAPAQLDRRMMSQMDLMAELTDCWVAWRLPLPLAAVATFEMVVVVFRDILKVALLQPKPDVLCQRFMWVERGFVILRRSPHGEPGKLYICRACPQESGVCRRPC